MKVTCRLAAPLAGESPQLDALLEAVAVSWLRPGAPVSLRGRGLPPPPGALHIPLERRRAGHWPVACCSSPILAADADYVEYVNRRLAVAEIADFLGGRRRRIDHGAGPTKAYHIPVRCRLVQAVVWFCLGRQDRRRGRRDIRRGAAAELRRWLQRVPAIGQFRAAGYGRVAEWLVEPVDQDWSWFAPSAAGPVLMRPLPAEVVGPEVVGARRAFAPVCPPYWHAERYTEACVPC